MTRNHDLACATAVGIVLVALTPSTAHAYIDPGVGLLVLQGVLASAVSGLFFARRLIYRAFSRNKPAAAATESASDSDAEARSKADTELDNTKRP